MFSFKTSSKNKRKTNKNSPTPITTTSTENKPLYNIPSVSQIAPLPQNKSHGTLPVLSLDGRDAPVIMQSDASEPDSLEDSNTSTNTNSRQPVGELLEYK